MMWERKEEGMQSKYTLLNRYGRARSRSLMMSFAAFRLSDSQEGKQGPKGTLIKVFR